MVVFIALPFNFRGRTISLYYTPQNGRWTGLKMNHKFIGITKQTGMPALGN